MSINRVPPAAAEAAAGGWTAHSGWAEAAHQRLLAYRAAAERPAEPPLTAEGHAQVVLWAQALGGVVGAGRAAAGSVVGLLLHLLVMLVAWPLGLLVYVVDTAVLAATGAFPGAAAPQVHLPTQAALAPRLVGVGVMLALLAAVATGLWWHYAHAPDGEEDSSEPDSLAAYLTV